MSHQHAWSLPRHLQSGGISGQQTPHLRPNHPRADPARWADAVADLPPAPVADAQQDVEMMDCDASPLPARPQGPPPGARRYASGASDLPSASEGATGGSAGVACASPDSEGPSSASTGASSRTQVQHSAPVLLALPTPPDWPGPGTPSPLTSLVFTARSTCCSAPRRHGSARRRC